MMQPEFVFLLGDSHVRSFANDPGFVPLFIGSGRQVRWTDDTFAERGAARLALNLARLPAAAPAILVFGEPDVRFTIAAGESIGDMRQALDGCIARRTAATQELASRFASPLAVLTCPPNRDADQNDLVGYYNAQLRAACAAGGIAMVDIESKLLAAKDGLLDARFCGDDIHLNGEIVALARNALAGHGLEPTTRADAPFAWSDFMKFPVADDCDTRIWGSASLDSASPQFAASELRRAAASAISAISKRARCKLIVVDNAREGHVPLAIAKSSGRSIVALERSPLRRRLGQLVANIAGRDDIEFCDAPPKRDVKERQILVDLSGSLPLGAMSVGYRIAFLMPDASPVSEFFGAGGFSETGRARIIAQTKSGAHLALCVFGCHSRQDRRLIEATFAALQGAVATTDRDRAPDVGASGQRS